MTAPRWSRRASFAWVAGCYLAAFAVASVVLLFLPEDLSSFWAVAIADVAATLVVFAFSRGLKCSSMYDAYGGRKLHWGIPSSSPFVVSPDAKGISSNIVYERRYIYSSFLLSSREFTLSKTQRKTTPAQGEQRRIHVVINGAFPEDQPAAPYQHHRK